MEVFDSIAVGYDESRVIPDGALSRIIAEIVSVMRAKPHSKILEIGAGTGRIGKHFVDRGFNYIGLDISLPMLEQFRRKYPDGLPDNMLLLHGDALNTPFLNETFQYILAFHVLYFIKDIHPFMEEIKRLLKPGGLFVHCDEVLVGADWLRELNGKWYELIAARNPYYKKLLEESNPLLFDSEESLVRISDMLKQAGYETEVHKGTRWINQISKHEYITFYKKGLDSFSINLSAEDKHIVLHNWLDYVNDRWPTDQPKFAKKQLYMLIFRKPENQER